MKKNNLIYKLFLLITLGFTSFESVEVDKKTQNSPIGDQNAGENSLKNIKSKLSRDIEKVLKYLQDTDLCAGQIKKRNALGIDGSYDGLIYPIFWEISVLYSYYSLISDLEKINDQIQKSHEFIQNELTNTLSSKKSKKSSPSIEELDKERKKAMDKISKIASSHKDLLKQSNFSTDILNRIEDLLSKDPIYKNISKDKSEKINEIKNQESIEDKKNLYTNKLDLTDAQFEKLKKDSDSLGEKYRTAVTILINFNINLESSTRDIKLMGMDFYVPSTIWFLIALIDACISGIGPIKKLEKDIKDIDFVHQSSDDHSKKSEAYNKARKNLSIFIGNAKKYIEKYNKELKKIKEKEAHNVDLILKNMIEDGSFIKIFPNSSREDVTKILFDQLVQL